MLRCLMIALAVPLALAGCAGESVWATDQEIEAVRYQHDGPPRLTLFTMVNNSSGAGAHTSLMINADERVIFDPAGSTKLSSVPERNDVLFGITPLAEDFYERAHARETHHVVIQEVDVSPEVARQAYRLALQAGPAAPAQCALVTSGILRQLPGFGSIPGTWYPNTLSEAMSRIPGVRSHELYEDDDADLNTALQQWDADRYRQQAAAE